MAETQKFSRSRERSALSYLPEVWVWWGASHTQPVTHAGEALFTLRQSTVNLPRCSHFRNHYLRLICSSKTGSSCSICILGYWNNYHITLIFKVCGSRTHWDLMAAATAWSDHVSIFLLTLSSFLPPPGPWPPLWLWPCLEKEKKTEIQNTIIS